MGRGKVSSYIGNNFQKLFSAKQIQIIEETVSRVGVFPYQLRWNGETKVVRAVWPGLTLRIEPDGTHKEECS